VDHVLQTLHSAPDLSGKTALITGASRGLGRALALRLSQHQARILAVGRSGAELASLVQEIESRGGTAHSLVCDLANSETVQDKLGAGIEAFGWPDIVVNNAGIAPSGPIARLDLDTWNATMALNATAPALIAKMVVPHLRTLDYGRVISIASVAALRGSPYIAAYAASKHALLGLTRVVAAEVRVPGVTVNAICPGFIDTDIVRMAIAGQVQRRGVTSQAALREILASTGQSRLIASEELCDLIVSLCAPQSHAIHGQAIEVLP
jgi:NAD(P)-dependent dehydrogenase (short-subunit alcohol dehydrogenase family)